MWLTFTRGAGLGHSVEVEGATLTIGRGPECDIVIPDARASRRHAEVRRLSDGGLLVTDLGSSNGTYVDEVRVLEPIEVRPGQHIQVGGAILRVDATRPGLDQTVVGQSTPPPPPGAAAPRGHSTADVLMLRRSVRRNTIIGLAALAAVLVVGGVVAALLLTGGDGDEEQTAAEIVDGARASTVRVLAEVDGEPVAGGTGWVLDAAQGLVVTNAHVLNSGSEFEVALEDEGERSADVVAVAPCEDLGVLRVGDTEGLRTIPLGDQSSLELGDSVVAVGFPGSASREANLTATTGVVSVVQTGFDLEVVDVPTYPNVIQTDTVINPGNSGGPLIDTHGRLVGVNSAGITLLGGQPIQGQGYAIGVDRVKEILSTLTGGDSIAWTGMGFVYPGADDRSALLQAGLPDDPGIVVDTAVLDSPAADAGFGQGPVLITAVNGEPITGTLPSYCAAAGDAEAGEQITFTVVQAGNSASEEVRVPVAGRS